MQKFDRLLSCTTWAYLASTIVALILMYLTGDRWWPGTLLLFSPRWALALPIIPLLPLVLWRRPGLLIPLVLAAAVICGPFMGFRFAFTAPQTVGKGVVRILSCNVGGKNFDAQKLSRLIQDLDVDIASLQESPRDLELELGTQWHALRSGSLCIFSKHPLKNFSPVKGIPVPGTWPLYPFYPCIAATPYGDILVYAVHLPTARYGLENMLDRKIGLNFKKLGYLVAETQKRSHVSQNARMAIETNKLPLVIAGDFNMPAESAIYRQHWGEFRNAFSASGWGYGFTFWGFHKGIPLPIRVDHIITGFGITPLDCKIGPDIGSDHRPIFAKLELP